MAAAGLTMRLYVVLRPIYWRGRIHFPDARVAMIEEQAAALIEGGYLRQVNDGTAPLNGADSRQWTAPTVR